MASHSTAAAQRSPITIAAGFLGAFVVASLAVQMVRTMTAAQPSTVSPTTTVPVVAHQATLWQELGQR
ncbi:hypothetical protein [Vulcanococcus sp.]|uniref:hypothetical protein n=1 Tax=Vulcanococcus sp. TaxID=2856995 RepID=UPI003F69E109